MKKALLSVIIALATITGAQASLRRAGLVPESLVNDSIDAGIALITWRGDTITAGGSDRFELASVYKFHQAVALSSIVPYESLLDMELSIDATDLPGGTWSPMRALFRELPAKVTPVELLDYSLNMSDNNACDIIWKNFLTPQQADSILRAQRRAVDFEIAATEAQMHADPALSMTNTSTPLDAAKLIYRFFTADTTASATLVKAVMSKETPFGAERIRAGIPHGNAAVFHKTGTGFDLPDGRISTINDLAFVSYPTSTGYGCYALAVFVRNAPSKAVAEQYIADVSRQVWHAIVVEESLAMNNRSYAPESQHDGKAPDTGLKDEATRNILGEAITDIILEAVFSRIFE